MALREAAPKTASTSRASSASSSHLPCTDSSTLGPDNPMRVPGQHRQAIGRAGEHRGAAEYVADGDRDDRDAAGTGIEQRGERAGERQFGCVGLVQSNTARREQQHDRRGRVLPRGLDHRSQRPAVTLADAARKVALVLCGDQHRRTLHAAAP